jgi:acyl carrier protein
MSKEAIRQWVLERNRELEVGDLADDTPLIERRYLTSLQVADLVLIRRRAEVSPSGEEITKRMAEVLGVPESRVRPDVVLTDLVSDSYRLVEMAIELQDDYDVILTQADLSGVTTVGELTDLVRNRVG